MEPWLDKNRLVPLWILLAVSAFVIVALANYTSLDLTLADRMFDFQQGQFAYKHAFMLETVMHSFAKQLLTFVWIVLVVIAWMPAKILHYRLSEATLYKLRWIGLLAFVNAIFVSCLKHQMPHACPWDVTRYGGNLPWAPTFSTHPAMEAGHCFPAGHATSGVWLAALCLLWLPQSPRKALLVALAGLSVGLILGLGQQLRGAHFLSHTLTSLWLMCSWLLIVITFSKSRIS